MTGPVYAPVAAELVIARRSDVLEADLRPLVEKALRDFLSLMPSGTGEGWPFGRDVFVSEVYDLLEQIPGIDFITDVMLSSQAKTNDDRSAAADPIWHREGDLVGLRMQQHHLPIFDSVNIVIAPADSFVVLNLAITATGTTDPATLKRVVRAGLRDLLHPAHHGPGPATGRATQIFISDITSAVERVAGIVSPVRNVVFSTVPDSASQMDPQRGAYIQVDAGRVLDWRVQISLT